MSAVAGAAAVTAVAAVASAARGPVEVDSEAIPLSGFALMTLLGAVLSGIVLAVMNRYAVQPRGRFLQATAALTALSCIPSLTSPPDTASKISLVVSHLFAAAVIVPILARNARH